MVDRQEARSDVDLDRCLSVQRYELAVLLLLNLIAVWADAVEFATFIPLVAGRVVSLVEDTPEAAVSGRCPDLLVRKASIDFLHFSLDLLCLR